MRRHRWVLLALGGSALGAPAAAAAGVAGRLAGFARDCGPEVECRLFEAIWGLINWLLTTL